MVAPPQVLVASSTSLGAVSEFFYGDTLQAVRAAHAAETAHGENHGEHMEPEEDMGDGWGWMGMDGDGWGWMGLGSKLTWPWLKWMNMDHEHR